jgi:hypothetical protein
MGGGGGGGGEKAHHAVTQLSSAQQRQTAAKPPPSRVEGRFCPPLVVLARRHNPNAAFNISKCHGSLRPSSSQTKPGGNAPPCKDVRRFAIPPHFLTFLSAVASPRGPKCAPCADFRSHTFEKGMVGCIIASRSSNGVGCTARLSPKLARPVGWTAAAVNTRDVRRGDGPTFGFGRSTSKDASSQVSDPLHPVLLRFTFRCLVERMIHLALRAAGYRRARFTKRCSCGRRHREFVKVGPNGSLEDIERIVRRSLKKIGEGDAPQ